MKLEIGAELKYKINSPGTIILNIQALRTPRQTVLEESLVIAPYIKTEELSGDQKENRLIRLEVENEENIDITYKAIVDNFYRETDHNDNHQIEIGKLDNTIIPYLYPSRYCQSDKLFRFANTKFGNINNPYEKVVAMTDWINANVEYLSGSTNSQTSAYDTVTELAGVCRDFAHLGIALCRALNIPARYFTGYAYQLSPADFHACFEAYLGKEWVLFDATRLVPLNGIIKIATGRDAADTAVASLFGSILGLEINVWCNLLEQPFEPFFNNAVTKKGLSYE